jgi:hypothetical protein
MPQFCAHPPSKSVADGSRGGEKEIVCTGAENQRGSKLSHSTLIVFGRSLIVLECLGQKQQAERLPESCTHQPPFAPLLSIDF